MDAVTKPRGPVLARLVSEEESASALLRQRLRGFIQDSFFVDEVANDTSFLATGIVDSLGILQIVAFVESELGARVPDLDLVPANFDSIDQIAAYVERRRRAA